MLLFKNGYFHIGDVSFCIPDGYYLETNPMLCLEDGLVLFPPDQSHTIELAGEYYEGDSKDTLAIIVKDFMQTKPIIPFVHNGLLGHIALYKDKKGLSYCEILFDIRSDEYNLFQVLFSLAQETNISNFTEHQDFLRIMQCIRKNDC